MPLQSDTSPFLGSRELGGELGQRWKGSPERGTGPATNSSIPSEQSWAGRGAPASPPTADTLGQQRLRVLGYDCQMLPVCGLTAFSTLREKNLYQIKKMSNVNGSCTQVLVGQRLPLLARLPNAKATTKHPSRYHQDVTQIQGDTSACSGQVCGGGKNLLSDPEPLRAPLAGCFQQKMLIHQNPNFLWE